MPVSEKLSRSERIRSDRRIDALFKEGRWGSAGPLKYCFRVSAAAIPDVGSNPHPVGDATIGRNDTMLPKDASRTGCDPHIESVFYRETFPNGNRGGAAAVSILVSVPKKSFKRAWKRNLIKRRIKESYRRRKHSLAETAASKGHHIDIAFLCVPVVEKGTPRSAIEIPDFKTIDDAIAKILEQILARS